MADKFTASNLHRHPRLRVPRRQGVHIGQHHVPRAVAAELLLVLAADDGEGVEHVASVVTRQAVEVEVEGVEAGAQVAAVVVVPREGRAVVAGRGRLRRLGVRLLRRNQGRQNLFNPHFSSIAGNEFYVRPHLKSQSHQMVGSQNIIL